MLAAALPDEVAAAVAAAERLGGGRLAVRSSGVDEDLAGASYAGQYESVLDVPGAVLAGIAASPGRYRGPGWC